MIGPEQALRGAMNALLYFPSRRIAQTPADADLAFDDLSFASEDGETLHGWFVRGRQPPLGHLLFCHGNAGNIGDRVFNAHLLAGVGFDVLLFDYRGYGHSSGKPDEDGTYVDAQAAREEMLRCPAVQPDRIFYLGESLGGAVALHLALAFAPAGLILQSTFTSLRDVARRHYPFIPGPLVPDAYPSIRLVRKLNAPLLVLHGERDQIVPASHAQALVDAAPEPKRLRLFGGLGHNDLAAGAGADYARAIAQWATERPGPPPAWA